jgi:hypothetical protein
VLSHGATMCASMSVLGVKGQLTNFAWLIAQIFCELFTESSRTQETSSYSQDTLSALIVAGRSVTTMNELINMIVQKTGISQEHAQKAAQVAVDFFKTKLPAPISAQLDSFLTGEATVGSNPVMEQAGGFLKGKLSDALGSKV